MEITVHHETLGRALSRNRDFVEMLRQTGMHDYVVCQNAFDASRDLELGIMCASLSLS